MSTDNLVKGSDCYVVLYDGAWKPYACARSNDNTVNTDVLETSVTGSGNWRTFEATAHSFDINLDGLVALNESGSLTLPELRALQFAKQKIYTRKVYVSVSGSTYTEECYVIITSSTETDSFDGVATFKVGLKGTGKITQIFTPPTPITQGDMRYPTQGNTAPATTGSYSWSLPGLTPTNTEITNVVKDGRGSNNIILSGTPVNNEVLFEEDPVSPGDGLLTWSVNFEDGETPPYITYKNI